MLNQQVSILEKMTLFWHNHFVTESDVIGDARQTYRYNDLLRQNALGNFKTLTKLITLNCAMLRYLNGNTNTGSSPNENYGRELQELFTIGKGPEIAPGQLYKLYRTGRQGRGERALRVERQQHDVSVVFYRQQARPG